MCYDNITGKVLIVGGPGALEVALVAGGWRVARSIDAGAPDLILLGPAAWAAAERLRAQDAVLAVVPMLAIVPADAPSMVPGAFDGTLAWPGDAAEVLEAVAAWRPGHIETTLERLRGAFGAEQVAALLARFRTLLLKAAAAGGGQMFAHRVAGIAGTLGFAETGRVWLRLSQGDASATEPARRAARRAIRLIDGQVSSAA